MCGLFGAISSSLVTQEIDATLELGIVSQLRGRHSTGVVLAYKEGWGKNSSYRFRTAKDTTDSAEFLFTNDMLTSLYGKDKPFLIAGHCRHATQGEISWENAHPFETENLIGMHNGTIVNMPGKTATGTDSEALINFLDQEGVQNTVNLIDRLNGAAALAWIDIDNQTFNLLRNDQRTLYFIKRTSVLYYCSDWYMLALIASRAGWHNPKIETLAPLLHIVMPLSSPIYDAKHRKYEATKQYSMPRTLFEPMTAKEAIEQEKKVEIKHTHTVLGPTVPITKARHGTEVKYQGFRGKKMEISKARILLQEGCAFCTEKVEIHDTDKAFFFNNKQFLCDTCVVCDEAKYNVNAHKTFPGRVISIDRKSGKVKEDVLH